MSRHRERHAVSRDGGRSGTFSERVVVDIERERFEIRRHGVVERVGVVVMHSGNVHPSVVRRRPERA